jgi:hypothetical protein
MTIIIKIRKLPMICDEGNHQWVTSGLTWGTLIITMDSPSIAPPRLFHYLPKVYTKHCEKAVNMA